MGYNEIVERHAPILGLKNLVTGEPCKPFVYMDHVEDGMWVHYATYCENIRKLKRALWLARTERAVAEQTVDEWSRYKEKHPFGSWREDPFEYWVQAWIYVEKLCRKKAKESDK